MLRHDTMETISKYLFLIIFLSKNIRFYKCDSVAVDYEYSYSDSEGLIENMTENYDIKSEDYDDNESRNYENESENNDNELKDYNNEYQSDTNYYEGDGIISISSQQAKELTIFAKNLKQELLLDQKSNFPNSNNITLPPNEFEREFIFRIITQSNNTNNGSGNYYSSFDTGNYGGVNTGELQNGSQVIKGHYTEKFKQDLPGVLPAIDVIRNVGYIADEKGYQPFIINYTIDDHLSDTDPQYDIRFSDTKRVSKEYKSHYKPLYNNIKLPDISKKTLVQDDSGNYNFSFDTLTYKRAESAETINQNTENETRIVKGQYDNFIRDGDEFVKQTIGYTADNNGFQPFVINYEADSVETPFEIPKHDYYNSERLAEDVSIHFKPLEEYKDVKLLNLYHQHQNKSSDEHQFSFYSDTYNRSEVSEIKNKGTENETLIIKGQYTEKIKNEFGEDVIRKIGYVADERGYQPFIIESYIENATAPPSIPFTRNYTQGTQYKDSVGSPRGKNIASTYVAAGVGWG